MERAVEALGKEKAHNQCMHTGPDAHLLTFPVAQHTLMNVVAFVPAPGPWLDEHRMAVPAKGDEVRAVFGNWRPAVRAITGLLLGEEEEGRPLDKWAIFDTYENPAPTYASGGVCIAGDAAHATSPHHGAGAGMGIEDALALATVLELAGDKAVETVQQGSDGSRRERSTAVAAALAAYDAVRRERTQWLVRSSREVSKTYEWSNPDCGDDPEKCLRDIEWRAHKIWHFDIDGMIAEAKTAFGQFLSLGQSQVVD
jgi:salicylate hydroxylase